MARTQVRLTSMGDPIGLDFGSVIRVFEMCDIPKEDHKRLLQAMCTCFEIEREYS